MLTVIVTSALVVGVASFSSLTGLKKARLPRWLAPFHEDYLPLGDWAPYLQLREFVSYAMEIHLSNTAARVVSVGVGPPTPTKPQVSGLGFLFGR